VRERGPSFRRKLRVLWKGLFVASSREYRPNGVESARIHLPRSIYWEGLVDDGLAAPDRVKWSRDASVQLSHRLGSLARIVHEGGLGSSNR